MSELDAPLTEDQQLLMAYIDDEMTPEQRTTFERRLAESPELAAEAANFRCLADVTQSMAIAEPTDREMQRFWANFYNRSEWQLGWTLLVASLAVLGGYGVYLLLVSATPAIVKIATLSGLLGGGILLWNTLRLKVRTSRYDRYRGVMR